MQMRATVMGLITLEPGGLDYLRGCDESIHATSCWEEAKATHCIMSSANVTLIGLQIIVTSTTSNKSSGYLNTLILPWGPMKDFFFFKDSVTK